MSRIIFLLGTARDGRASQLVFNFVKECTAKRPDIEPVFVDIADFLQNKTIAPEKISPNKWQELLSSVQGLVIVAPEYNHGYPGELKLLLDSAYQEYAGKPAAICAVSNGPIGGARMAEQLKLVLSAFQMTIINAAVYFANVNELFTSSGTINNVDFWQSRVNGLLDQIIKHSK